MHETVRFSNLALLVSGNNASNCLFNNDELTSVTDGDNICSKQTVIMEELIASVHLYFHSIHRSQTKERRGDGHVASGEGAL
jgi:hypothetical protein